MTDSATLLTIVGEYGVDVENIPPFFSDLFPIFGQILGHNINREDICLLRRYLNNTKLIKVIGEGDSGSQIRELVQEGIDEYKEIYEPVLDYMEENIPQIKYLITLIARDSVNRQYNPRHDSSNPFQALNLSDLKRYIERDASVHSSIVFGIASIIELTLLINNDGLEITPEDMSDDIQFISMSLGEIILNLGLH